MSKLFFTGLLVMSTLVLATGCGTSVNRNKAASQAATSAAQNGAFHIALNNGATLIYDEESAFGSFVLDHALSYQLNLSSIYSPADGVIYTLSIDGGTPVAINPGAIAVPSATFPMPAAGSHSLSIMADASSVGDDPVTSTYTFTVQ